MAFRKIIIAVDCTSDAEAARVQAAAKMISEQFRLRGGDILALAPMVEKNGVVISSAIRTISREGMSGAVKMIPYLIKNFKK